MAYYKNGVITSSPFIESVINPTQEKILETGWLIYLDIAPEYNVETQKIEKIGITESKDTATVNYQILDLTEEELREKNVPHTITKGQGKLQLLILGIFTQVEAIIYQSGNMEKIYWNDWEIWERSSPILNRLAPNVGMSPSDLDQFFIEASKLK